MFYARGISAALLRDLHVPGRPLVLRNAWDAASAKALADGVPAIATTSVGVAEALGYDDGGNVPAAEAFAALARIAAAVDVPVTHDSEAGYGLQPAAFVEGLLAAGGVGCNLEDTDHATADLRDMAEQARFLAAVRAAAGDRVVINARVDVHLRGGTLADGLARARAYREAGADCVYPIFVQGEEAIAAYVEAAGVVNVNLGPNTLPVATLAGLGVARASFGAFLYKRAMAAAVATAQG